MPLRHWCPLLRDGDRDVREYAIVALGLIGGEYAVDELLRLLKDEDKDMRRWAATALGELGDARALGELIKISLKEADSWGRRRAISALAKLGGEGAINALLPLLKGEDKELRLFAAQALGKLGDERAVNELSPLLKDGDRDWRRRAVDALGELGGERAVDALVPMLKDEDHRVRVDTVTALGLIRSERAVDELLPLLDRKNLANKMSYSELCAEAALALGRIGSVRAVDELVNVLRSENKLISESKIQPFPSDDVRPRVISALARIGDERAVAALLPLLDIRHDDPIMRKSAAKAIAEIDDSVLAVGLVRALADEDELVRSNAVQVVGYYVRDEQMLHELARLAAEDPSGEVRSQADEARHKYEHKLKYFGIEPVMNVAPPPAQGSWFPRPLSKAFQAIRDRARRLGI